MKRAAAGIIVMLISAIVFLAACSTTNSSQGAPPVPHRVTEQLCVDCHRMGTNGAPKMNHSARGTCITCHTPSR